MTYIISFLQTLTPLIYLIAGLMIFLFGMKTMSEGIQKRTGSRLQNFLQVITDKPLAGVLMGASVTAIIQSSSATTVMLVSLVNAGLLSLRQSIGVLMGANIGTTMTAWIVSIFGFKFKIIGIAFFAIAASLPLHFSKKEKLVDISNILLGFGLLFLGLHEMKESVSIVKENAAFLEFLAGFTHWGYGSLILFIIVGTLLTIAVQSSSAAMTITLTMLYNGWIPFEIAAAIVLGENIGTTITAFLASLEMSNTAKQTARAHMIFNLIGVVWMLILFYPVIRLLEIIIPISKDDTANLTFHLSGFHTFFNIMNTLILIWFIPQLEKLVRFFVPDKPGEINRPYKIHFIHSQVADQIEVNSINAKVEVGKMSNTTGVMMQEIMDLLEMDRKSGCALVEEIIDKEEFIDEMNVELNNFLVELSLYPMSESQAHWAAANLRIIGELESIGDSIKRIGVLLCKQKSKKIEIHKNSMDQLQVFAQRTMDFLSYNTNFLTGKIDDQDLDLAKSMEQDIHDMKRSLQKKSRNKIKSGGNLKGELLFMEMIRQFELIGEFCINIVQTMQGTIEKHK